MPDKKEDHVSRGGTRLGLIVGIIVAAIVLFTVLVSLEVFDGKPGANVNIDIPKIETPEG